MVLSKRWVLLLLSTYDPQAHRAAVLVRMGVARVYLWEVRPGRVSCNPQRILLPRIVLPRFGLARPIDGVRSTLQAAVYVWLQSLVYIGGNKRFCAEEMQKLMEQ